MKRGYAAIKKVTTRFRATADHLQFVSGKPHGVQLREVTRHRLSLAINKSLAGIALNRNSQLPIDRVAAMHNSRQDGGGLSKSYGFMKMMSAKRFCVREELNGLQPIGFSLSVVTVENVYAGREINRTLEIAKAFDFD
jgi:hypothetical protein